MSDTPVLSIVCGTYNRRDQIERLVDSVARETRLPHILYVTDAGSTDGTIEYLQSVASNTVRPIFVGELLGQAKAYNDVFRQVTTPYVCWVSDDNEIVEGGLDKAVEILRKDRRIGMVGLKVRDKDGPFVKAPYIGGVSQIGVLNVNQGMLPTEVMNAVGGFSEDFRDYGIDPDLTAKVLFGGWDIVYTRDIAIHHYRNWAEDAESEDYKKLQAKHDRFKSLYEDTYGRFKKKTPAWLLKKFLWAQANKMDFLKKRLGINSSETVFGHLPRDYYNTLMAKHVGLFDLIASRGQPWHLRQRYRGRKIAASELSAASHKPAE